VPDFHFNGEGNSRMRRSSKIDGQQMKYLILLTLSVLILNCSREKNPLGPSGTSDFAIYFLKDPSIRARQIINRDLTRIELETKPWLSSKDIDFYDFSTHCIYLKTDKSHFFENFKVPYQFPPSWVEKPFVVVAGGERCYIGFFHSGLLSTASVVPYIDELDIGSYPEDVMHISRAWGNSQDTRKDERVRNALIEANLYHAGLNLRLNSVVVLENADTSTVQYKFTITNDDQDNLYIIDPDLMGSERFHYFTNGVVLWNETTQNLLESQYKTTTSPSPLKLEWFTKIESNQSIQRTVTLKGYPKIPKGSYACDFTFANPPVQRNQRLLTDGRIWIGKISSNRINMIVN